MYAEGSLVFHHVSIVRGQRRVYTELVTPDNSYPDVTLLCPLARVLDTNVSLKYNVSAYWQGEV